MATVACRCTNLSNTSTITLTTGCITIGPIVSSRSSCRPAPPTSPSLGRFTSPTRRHWRTSRRGRSQCVGRRAEQTLASSRPAGSVAAVAIRSAGVDSVRAETPLAGTSGLRRACLSHGDSRGAAARARLCGPRRSADCRLRTRSRVVGSGRRVQRACRQAARRRLTCTPWHWPNYWATPPRSG